MKHIQFGRIVAAIVLSLTSILAINAPHALAISVNNSFVTVKIEHGN
jgi:hypothetical protein